MSKKKVNIAGKILLSCCSSDQYEKYITKNEINDENEILKEIDKNINYETPSSK